MRGIVPATVLVTLGILFMLENFDVASFHRTWPVFLIALGVAIAVQRSVRPASNAACCPPEAPETQSPPAQEVKRG